jgi:hypothetical protein
LLIAEDRKGFLLLLGPFLFHRGIAADKITRGDTAAFLGDRNPQAAGFTGVLIAHIRFPFGPRLGSTAFASPCLFGRHIFLLFSGSVYLFE